jgi:sigma-B regulation protein RsbU (phosphoserine phosphatase)
VNGTFDPTTGMQTEGTAMYATKRDTTDRQIRQLRRMLSKKNAELAAKEHEIEAKDQEVDKIAEIQQSLLPATAPQIPGMSVAVSHVAPEKAGGDYFDFVPLKNGANGPDHEGQSWLIIIADATGHGPASAVVMTMMHSILHAYPGPHEDPADVLDFMNREMCDKHLESFFATCVLAILNPGARTFHYSCAGHYSPLIKQPAIPYIRETRADGGLPLGVEATAKFGSYKHSIGPGQTLLLYTDGAIEETNGRGDPFGIDGLKAAMADAPGEPNALLQRINEAIALHQSGAAQLDDKTMIAMQMVSDS